MQVQGIQKKKETKQIRVFSFSKQGLELKPVEVEMSFLPGLPQFQIIGLPDAMIKESQIKIKSALRAQGYKLPTSHQVIVNLRPNHIRKTSRGLDLAIAINYLLLSKQIQPKLLGDSVYLYGELGLDGGVKTPEDFSCLIDPPQSTVYTGHFKHPRQDIYALESLSDFLEPTLIKKSNLGFKLKRPLFKDLILKKQAYRLACITATGEHSTLLAGSAGTGKTTLSQAIFNILRDPCNKTYSEIQNLNALFNYNCHWRPCVSPHHTTPPLSLIGGGAPPFPGEITRAHGGVLILDEFLEFNRLVLETLREPIETKRITVARRGKKLTYPADFLLLATTNLCPCGKFTPNNNIDCKYSLKKCQSYLQKLSGPLLDRFSIMNFTQSWKGEYKSSIEDAKKEVQRSSEFIKKRGQICKNSELDCDDIESSLNTFTKTNLLPEFPSSFRRRKAFFQVARSIADLDESKEIKPKHLNESFEFTIKPFIDLDN